MSEIINASRATEKERESKRARERKREREEKEDKDRERDKLNGKIEKLQGAGQIDRQTDRQKEYQYRDECGRLWHSQHEVINRHLMDR
jgi:hypothetical protein